MAGRAREGHSKERHGAQVHPGPAVSQKGHVLNCLQVVPTLPGETHRVPCSQSNIYYLDRNPISHEVQTGMGISWMRENNSVHLEGMFLLKWIYWWFFIFVYSCYESGNPVFVNVPTWTWTFAGAKIIPSYEVSFWKIN